MFTFGIFTTHIPFIAMIACYAYFLLFGFQQVSDNKVQFSEKSAFVQMHIDNGLETFQADSHCYYASFYEHIDSEQLSQALCKQKWKVCCVARIVPHDFTDDALFCRPPPCLA